MFCPECGKQVEEGALFCPECGTKVVQQPQQQPADSAPTANVNPEPTVEANQAPASNAANANTTEQPAAEPTQAASAQNESARPNPEGETAGAKAGKVIDDTMSKFKALDKPRNTASWAAASQ